MFGNLHIARTDVQDDLFKIPIPVRGNNHSTAIIRPFHVLSRYIATQIAANITPTSILIFLLDSPK